MTLCSYLVHNDDAADDDGCAGGGMLCISNKVICLNYFLLFVEDYGVLFHALLVYKLLTF